MVTADFIYKFRSKILKNLYNDLRNTKGELVESIYNDLEGKVKEVEFRIQESFIKVTMKDESDTKDFTDIFNIIDRNLRKFIYLNQDKLDLKSDEVGIFNEFINGNSLYELFTIGKQIQFNL